MRQDLGGDLHDLRSGQFNAADAAHGHAGDADRGASSRPPTWRSRSDGVSRGEQAASHAGSWRIIAAIRARVNRDEQALLCVRRTWTGFSCFQRGVPRVWAMLLTKWYTMGIVRSENVRRGAASAWMTPSCNIRIRSPIWRASPCRGSMAMLVDAQLAPDPADHRVDAGGGDGSVRWWVYRTNRTVTVDDGAPLPHVCACRRRLAIFVPVPGSSDQGMSNASSTRRRISAGVCFRSRRRTNPTFSRR